MHIVRALLASGPASRGALSSRVADFTAAPIGWYYLRGSVRARSQLVLSACAIIGLEEVVALHGGGQSVPNRAIQQTASLRRARSADWQSAGSRTGSPLSAPRHNCGDVWRAG